MDGFERLNLVDQNNYVPFDQFIQQHYPMMTSVSNNGSSNLTASAAEFVPNSRREQNTVESHQVVVENGSHFVANGQMSHRTDDEKYKGAIRKQYTNNNHGRNYQRHHQTQYKDYNRGRHYGEADRSSSNGFGNDNNWRRRDDFHRRQGGSQRDLSHKPRNNKNERNDSNKYNKYYTKAAQSHTQKRSPEAQYPKFDASNCSQREKLTKEIENSVLECMICCENIKSVQSVYACHSCYHVFHLSCITKWATSSFTEGWRCPACNSFKDAVPKEYFCFCGKLKDPSYNRNDVPHSCGEMCAKLCEQGDHKCTLLCHPGEILYLLSMTYLPINVYFRSL